MFRLSTRSEIVQNFLNLKLFFKKKLFYSVLKVIISIQDNRNIKIEKYCDNIVGDKWKEVQREQVENEQIEMAFRVDILLI